LINDNKNLKVCKEVVAKIKKDRNNSVKAGLRDSIDSISVQDFIASKAENVMQSYTEHEKQWREFFQEK